MMKVCTFRAVAGVLVAASWAVAVDPVVNLGYSSYRGRVVGDGTTQWLGMRYAAPPVSQLRFAAPQDPPTTEGVQDATKFGNICLAQNPTDWSMKPNPRFTPGEDCLYLNIFAPSNTSASAKLPVMFFIQGGGFGSNSNANYNASDLAREGRMVVVSVNYRVGPYGFLQGREIEEGGSNAGVRDVVKALEWVREYVGKFGGDPTHVVLNGDSAGASTIVLLLTSPKMKDTDLFVGAIMESASEATLRTLEQGQEQYDCLLKATGCVNPTRASSLDCLRSLNATKLQTTNCWFNPHIDDDLIPQTTFSAFDKGDYLKIPTIFGSCQDEGTKGPPQTTDTLNDYHAYVLDQCPSLSNHSLQVLDRLYVLNKSEPVFPNSGRLWRQASNTIGDARSHCVDKYYQDAIARDGGKTWSYRYAVIDPTLEAQGIGAYHTIELYAVWGPNNTDGNPPKSYVPGRENEHIVDVVRSYWTSFVKYLDPNKARLAGTPEWGLRGEGGERLRFVTNATKIEVIDSGEAGRCRVLKPMMEAMEQAPGEGIKTELRL